MSLFKVGFKWKGFYDAPLPYGRREYTCEIIEIKDEYNFIGQGEDAEGQFSIKGSLSNIKTIVEDGTEHQTCDVHFNKDYLSDDGYKGIQYNGKLVQEKITGEYSFLWKKAFLSKTVTGKFEMDLVR